MFVAQADKRAALERVLRDDAVERAIVFTRTKRGANRLSEQLTRSGIGAAAIHGNKSQSARERALEAFRRGSTRVREVAPEYRVQGPPAAYAVVMGDRGRLVLPMDVRERLGIKEGDRLTLRVDDDGTIRVQTGAAFARSLLGAYKHLAAGRMMSDELIAERRREARLEARKDRELSTRLRRTKR